MSCSYLNERLSCALVEKDCKFRTLVPDLGDRLENGESDVQVHIQFARCSEAGAIKVFVDPPSGRNDVT